MTLEPVLGSFYHLEEIFVFLVPYKFGFTSFFSHPFLSVQRVRVDSVVEVVFLLPSEAMDYSEELPDIVCTSFKHRAFKQLLTCIDEDASIFHFSGVARAGGIDGDSVRQGTGSIRRQSVQGFHLAVFTKVWQMIRLKSLFGGGSIREALIQGTLEALDLFSAFVPAGKDSYVPAAPYCIKLVFHVAKIDIFLREKEKVGKERATKYELRGSIY